MLDLSGAGLYLQSKVYQKFEIYDPYDSKYFMSINAHRKNRLYPRDDLEAIGLMLFFLLNRGLPNARGNNNPAFTEHDLVAGKEQEFLEVSILSRQ